MLVRLAGDRFRSIAKNRQSLFAEGVQNAWIHHSLVPGVCQAVSADSDGLDGLDGLAAARQGSGGGLALSGSEARCQPASAGGPGQVVSRDLTAPTLSSACDGDVNSAGDRPTGCVLRAVAKSQPETAAWQAANDPQMPAARITGSAPLTPGPTVPHVAPEQQPAGERRLSDRRHIARRRDDGKPDCWRRDDRRSIERRRDARLGPGGTGTAGIQIPAVAGLAVDAATISVFIAARLHDRIAALAFGLACEPAMKLVCACPTGDADFHARVTAASPNIVLIDTALFAAVGARTLSGLRASAARARLILLWDEAHPVAVEEIERHGIDGCIPLLAPARLYARAIREVSRGGLWLPRWIMNRVCRRVLGRNDSEAVAAGVRASVLQALTVREQAIAGRVAAGRTNKEIALELNVSPDTVKKHLGAIFRKVGVQRRSQLASCLGAGPQRREH